LCVYLTISCDNPVDFLIVGIPPVPSESVSELGIGLKLSFKHKSLNHDSQMHDGKIFRYVIWG